MNRNKTVRSVTHKGLFMYVCMYVYALCVCFEINCFQHYLEFVLKNVCTRYFVIVLFLVWGYCSQYCRSGRSCSGCAFPPG